MADRVLASRIYRAPSQRDLMSQKQPNQKAHYQNNALVKSVANLMAIFQGRFRYLPLQGPLASEASRPVTAMEHNGGFRPSPNSAEGGLGVACLSLTKKKGLAPCEN